MIGIVYSYVMKGNGMQSKEKNNMIFMRLFPDEDIQEKLKEACRLHDIKTAVVLSGIGQLKKIKLGYFKKYNLVKFFKTIRYNNEPNSNSNSYL